MSEEKPLSDETIATVKELLASDIKTYDKKGRGRKQCPHCKVIVGVRNKTCICGKPFIKKKDLPKEEDPLKEETLTFVRNLGFYNGNRVIYTPRGKCPVKLKDDVITWAINLIGYCESLGDVLSIRAIKYWLGKIHPPHTAKCKKMKAKLDEWYARTLKNV